MPSATPDCGRATTALDVTIQAQILDLIRQLRDQLGMSVLLITHNMGVVASIADRVSVMYLGVIVETGTVHEVFEQAAHPYTQGLLASIPSLHSEPKTPLQSLKGVVPELALAPQGCVFADRCSEVMSKCLETPPLITLSEQHKAKCWLYDSPAPAGAITLESPHSQTGEVVDERPPAPPTKAPGAPCGCGGRRRGGCCRAFAGTQANRVRAGVQMMAMSESESERCRSTIRSTRASYVERWARSRL